MAFIKFLGTAGARFVMIEQLRSSGGLWISNKDTNVLVDPGPGSIVRCSTSRPKLNPAKLDAIILTHKHLDHANDINVMIEGMTEGGFKKRGVVFCPADALGEGSVIQQYAAKFPERITALEAKGSYRAGDFSFQTSMRHIHPVETYGLKFSLGDTCVGLLTDTKFFPELESFYKTDILIVSVVFFEPSQGIDHLSLVDAEEIIRACKPKKAVLTHFGRTMLKAKPHIQAQALTKRLGIEVVAANDGMSLIL